MYLHRVARAGLFFFLSFKCAAVVSFSKPSLELSVNVGWHIVAFFLADHKNRMFQTREHALFQREKQDSSKFHGHCFSQLVP